MHALKAGDPPFVGGYRLLGRLGSGGMGVVYLARSTGGALAALKVIRAEYAADHGFRVRFRREAEAAEGLTGQWLVPVVAADPGAAEPWLATAFVPGPSLAEAVTLHGPLPDRTVRVLGARLAEALVEVHAAGLVHRDVKPGNVLLALDGPRLIDFGIARSTGATALTASDVVIGSPGYLSPEQARAGAGDVGPPSDVFSLGCVLAYAATGRRPFGTGTPAAVVFRTVHEEPDLDAVPWALVPLLTDCLAKDPEARPTAREVCDALAGGSEREGAWLPPALPRLIAERSAAVLALPDPEPDTATLLSTPEPPALSRRRLLTLGSAAAVVVTGGGLAAWAAGRRGNGDGGTAGEPLPRYAIGLHADLSGTGKAVGRAQERGVRLAVADFNSRADRAFDLTLKVRDDGGRATRAQQVAAAFIADRTVYAVIGPTGDASSTEAVVARYEKALLPLVTVSAGTDAFTAAIDRVFFQLRPDESVLSTAFIHYLTHNAKSVRTSVIDDRAAGRLGWEIVKDLTEWPPAEGRTTSHVVPAADADFGPAAAAVLAAGAQGVVYAGASPHRGALCARALERAGFKGTLMAPEPVLETGFLTEAGTAAEGWLFSTTYVDPAQLPAAARFVTSYEKRFGVRSVEPFAVEAYDALNFVAQGLRALGTAGVERGAMVQRLRASTYKGLAKTIRFEASTDQFDWADGLFLHRVENGGPRFLGRYDKVEQT
ncbi:bifunctional serine/threonine-protein kinase/ABC transporter substrate-binding protein [Streptomyces sp. NBC_01478]|uniref:bifunctional serine/threonine-protein kinase/ABC transporter substrate-binding protein n=1 Tax=Streptomyces sp. NBC_01478 TaxID=2903882 RepID=UPI002E319A57|nr:bifunctional serine/threonine-protein kinase/ABC transporter substrate-binding protein [Streptomyces sp. NBC_01478]